MMRFFKKIIVSLAVVALLVVPQVSVACEIYTSTLFSDPDLVHYWRLDGNANDSSGSNNGTATNVTWAAAEFNDGAFFNGSTSKIDLTTFAFDSTNMTVVMWVNVSSSAPDRAMMLHSQGTQYWEVGIDVSGSNRRIEYQDNVAGRIVAVPDGGTLADGNWHQVAVTKSGASIEVYIDGSSKATGTGISGNSNSGATKSSLGYDATSNANFFKDGLDDVAIFTQVLTAQEISELYAGTTGVCGSGGGGGTTSTLQFASSTFAAFFDAHTTSFLWLGVGLLFLGFVHVFYSVGKAMVHWIKLNS